MTNGRNGAHPSNYEVTRRRMQAQFAALDFRKIAEVWALDWLDGGLYADLVSRCFRIDDKTGFPDSAGKPVIRNVGWRDQAQVAFMSVG